MTRDRLGIVAALLLLSAVAIHPLWADEHSFITQELTPPPFQIHHNWQYHIPRHIGHYEPLHLEWQLEARVPDAVNLFADPHVPAHFIVATSHGLVETVDHGQSWQPMPAGSVDKIGPVSSLVLRPDSILTMYVASRTTGLWITSDGGKSFKQLATKATGLASDSIQNIFLYPADRLRRTLFLTHGDDAAGVSRSVDAGKTWQLVYPDYNVWQMAFSGESTEVSLVAAAVRQPELRSLYFLQSPDQPWQTLISDISATSTAAPILPRDAIYLATSDKGFFKIAANGGLAINLDSLRDHEWSSLGCTFASTADSEVYYAYDPKQLGLVLFTPEQLEAKTPAPNAAQPAAPYSTQSHGLFTGPLVMEGSRIVANANGTVFYAVANKTLYVAHDSARSLLVRDVAVDPPLHNLEPEIVRDAFGKIDQVLDTFTKQDNLLTAAAELQPQLQEHINSLAHVTITAHVESLPGHPPKSVTVDLSRLGLSERSILSNDGQHNAGLYTNTFYFDSLNFAHTPNEWRPGWPGTLGLTVSAVADDGKLSGAVGLLTICQRTRSLPYSWYPPNRESGDVKGDNTWDQTYGTMNRIIASKPGPWSTGMSIISPRPTDISGCYALTFRIRATHETTDDVLIQFQDSPTYAISSKSDPVAIIKEGFLPSGKITTQFQRVMIPVSRILRNPGKFDPGTTAAMFLSSNSSAPQEFLLHDLHFCPTDEDLPTDQTGK